MSQLFTLFTLVLVIGLNVNSSTAQTWSSDVADIVYAKCTPCHREGEIAPFPLERYDDAANYGSLIKHAIEIGEMPPWPPAKGHGDFLGDRSLSDAEKNTIIAWIDANMPEGDPATAPKPPVFPEGSQLGTPDLVLEMSETWTVQDNYKDVYRFFVIPTNLVKDRNIKAIEFRPGNAKVVHHVLYFLDTTGTARARDAADPAPGYAGFGDPGFETASSYLGWVPGAQQRFYPESIGARMYQGSDLVIQVHYAPSTTIETDRSRVNIFFHDEEEVREVQEFALTPRELVTGNFVIPANAERTFLTSFTIPIDVSIIAVAPHMHLLGSSARAFAINPTGDTIRLIRINDWDFHWQGGYAFRHPIKVPRGSKLYYEATYNNTTSNPHNPNTPPRLVTWGESTTDEMLLCYFHWLPFQAGDEALNMETTVGVREEQPLGGMVLSSAPQPASDRARVRITSDQEAEITLSLMDHLGRTAANSASTHVISPGENDLPIDVSGCASGLWYAVITTNGTSRTLPIVVLH